MSCTRVILLPPEVKNFLLLCPGLIPRCKSKNVTFAVLGRCFDLLDSHTFSNGPKEPKRTARPRERRPRPKGGLQECRTHTARRISTCMHQRPTYFVSRWWRLIQTSWHARIAPAGRHACMQVGRRRPPASPVFSPSTSSTSYRLMSWGRGGGRGDWQVP